MENCEPEEMMAAKGGKRKAAGGKKSRKGKGKKGRRKRAVAK